MKRNTYTFTVKHGDWSAIIETHSDHTLYDLAETILRAVKFDNDHAFGFYEPDYFKSRRGGRSDRGECEQYTLFADIDPSEAAEGDHGVQSVPVSGVFEVGDPYVFLFDYGDDWRFELICTNIAMGTKLKKKTAILSTIGTPPEQYPDYEEEEL